MDGVVRSLIVGTLLSCVCAAAAAAPVVHKLSPQELAACKAKGGRPEMVLSFVQSCVWPTRDSGKVCRDKSDCQGFCQAALGTERGAKVAGTCSKVGSDRIGGCWNLVEHGRSAGDICVD